MNDLQKLLRGPFVDPLRGRYMRGYVPTLRRTRQPAREGIGDLDSHTLL